MLLFPKSFYFIFSNINTHKITQVSAEIKMFKKHKHTQININNNRLVFVSYYLSLPSTKPNFPNTPKTKAAGSGHSPRPGCRRQPPKADRRTEPGRDDPTDTGGQPSGGRLSSGRRPTRSTDWNGQLSSVPLFSPLGGVSLSMFV